MKNAISWEQVKKEAFTPQELKVLEQRFQIKMALRKLKEFRLQKRLSQQELAQKAELPRTTISKIESRYQNASMLKIMQVAEALGKDVEIRLVDRVKTKA